MQKSHNTEKNKKIPGIGRSNTYEPLRRFPASQEDKYRDKKK